VAGVEEFADDGRANEAGSATVVAVIVLIGGWSNVTRQWLALGPSIRRCVHDCDQVSDPSELLDALVPVLVISVSSELTSVTSARRRRA
jgi:hypothetical protein